MKSVGRKNILQFVIGRLRDEVKKTAWFNGLPQRKQADMRVVVTDVVEKKGMFGLPSRHVAIGYVTEGEYEVSFEASVKIGAITINDGSY